MLVEFNRQPVPCCISVPGAQLGAKFRMCGSSSGLEYQRGHSVAGLELNVRLGGAL